MSLFYRCKVDETVEIYANGNNSKVQFAMKAFKFIGQHDQVMAGHCADTALLEIPGQVIVFCRFS